MMPDGMLGQRFDYSGERQRHEKLVGRAQLLAQLDQLLVNGDGDHWVVVTGGPGMGKSAILAAWLARREAAGAVVPHHFIRRGQYDWDDPAQLVGALVDQLEDRSATLREPEGDARMHPAARLARMLARVSEHELVPRGERLVVLIDGLDEYDPPAKTLPGDPLNAFLPHTLPAGVSVLCASRPRHPYVASLAARDGEFVQINLDDPASAADNEATVRAFWERAAGSLGLDLRDHEDARFVDEVVARADGNVQHAVQLHKQLTALGPEQRRATRHRIDDIPRGLEALIVQAWERIAVDPIVTNGLGILCAAREAFSLDELGTVAGWAGDAQRRAFIRGAMELLVETQRPDGTREYRLHHDSIRAYISREIGLIALAEHHRSVARRLASWPSSPGASSRRYALRHAVIHRVEAGDQADAWLIAADVSLLEARCRELGVAEAEADVTRLAARCRASGDEALGQRADDLARALARESHWLRAAPEAITALVWNRLRRLGWSASDLHEQLRVPEGANFLRVRHVHTRESPALVRDLVDHTASVNACVVTPDGRYVVSASFDQTLKVWDLASGRLLTTLEGHTHGVWACAVTPDSRHVISASLDTTLKVWDLARGRALATLEGHTHEVWACAVTPDSRHVVSASLDTTLKVWDLASRRVLTTLKGHSGGVTACAMTPDGRRVVSASWDGTLKLWDLATELALATFEGHSGGVTACAVTPDGMRVVSASRDGTLKLWDLATGRALATLQSHTDVVTACAVTPDGRRVVSASEDKTLKLWDLETESAVATLQGHTDMMWACVVTPDGRLVVSASKDKTLKVWNLTTERALVTLQGHTDRVTACAATPDGGCVVSASWDETLKVWDPETGCERAILEGHTDRVTACAVTPNGGCVVSASRDETLKVWAPETGRERATFEGHTNWVNACAVTPDGGYVISASGDGTLRVWESATKRTRAILEGHTDFVNACAVTLDGRHVVSASEDQTLKIWDLEAGSALATLEGHTDFVNACAVTPDGRHVVSASEDQTLKIWELATGRALATLEGHTDAVMACAVTPDGQCVVSASGDNTLKVWDLETYSCLVTHHGDTSYLAVAATTTAIIAGDRAGSVWFLDLPSHRIPPRPRASDGASSKLASYAAIPSRPRMNKHTILFLAANPIGTDPRALDREAHAIQAELERGGYRDGFELVTRWAAEPIDLLRELRKLKPTVVHFSGHGVQHQLGTQRPSGVLRRDVGGDMGHPEDETRDGLYFQGSDGRAQLVSGKALQETFGAAGSSVQLVVLSACYSASQADALRVHVDCVVGMRSEFSDGAARAFAIGFYGGLGERESIAAAYRQGCAAISLEGLPDTARPQLALRDGIDAEQLVLVSFVKASQMQADLDRHTHSSHQTWETSMTRDNLLTRLSQLLPSQFEEVLFRARIPTADLPGVSAPQKTRAIDAIRYLEQQNRLDQLARILDEVAPGPR
jgi:WD40 repeat protein